MTPTPPPSLIASALHIFPHALQLDTARYLGAALLMAAIVWAVERTRWRVLRLQTRRAGRSDLIRELLTSARSIVIYAVVATLIYWSAMHGWTHMALHSTPSLPVFLIYLGAILIVHDAYFYWTHRAMHSRALFKTFHRTHHRSVTPTPFTAYAFDWTEAWVQAAFVMIWVMTIPTPLVVLLTFMIVQILRNVWGHCGMELSPRWWVDHPIFRHITTTTHHDLHHNGGFKTNYGLYFTWWDRWMGTEHPRYRDTFYAAKDRAAAAKQAARATRKIAKA